MKNKFTDFFTKKSAKNTSSKSAENSKSHGAFFISPKSIVTDPQLSAFARLLFIQFFDRAKLSECNGFCEDNGEVFFYYTLPQISDFLGCGVKKAADVVNELESYGLIRRKKQGQGKATKFYLCREHIPDVTVKKRKKDSSEAVINEAFELSEMHGNNNKVSNNKMSNSPSREVREVVAEIKENIEYDLLIGTEHADDVDNLVLLMAETICSPARKIKIGGVKYDRSVVEERFMAINSLHISYVLDKITEGNTKIENVNGFVLKLLFEAEASMSLYYTARFSYDMSHR